LILLNSSLPKGIAYVETKGLDGETNLKQKIARSEVLPLALSEANLWANLSGATITCDMPNADLYKFNGQLRLADGALIPL
jgi:phospholipid-translocating ATPase